MPRTNHYLRTSPPALGQVKADSWRERAACRSHPTLPPRTWDDSVTLDDDRQEDWRQRAARINAAIAACGFCPVKAPCLADVDLAYDEGVRGGVDLRRLRQAKVTSA